MKKTDFIAHIAEQLQSSKAEAARTVDVVLDTLQHVFLQHEVLALPGFATFGVKKRAARSGRNPATGKAIQIPEATLPYIRVSSKIKAMMAQKPTAAKKKAAKK